jgi:cytochrome c biogenesis protein
LANAQTATGARGFELDPFRWLWRLLTSVRFALYLIGFLAFASAIGLAVPQVPAQMVGNPAAESAWLEFQREKFGLLTDPMNRLGLFDVYRSMWFATALAVLVLSVCVCTANRLQPVWRNVTRPQTRVPDEYFSRGQPVVAVAAPPTGALVGELQRRRYRVTLTEEDGQVHLFADRFPFAQLATFISHLALILFIAGGLVTVVTAEERQILIGEGESLPVFAPTHPNHMQIYAEEAIGKFDDRGFPLDYRTYLVVYKGGQEVARGYTTVNDPLTYGGYKFHQSAFFPDGIGLRVRDLTTGRVVYDEVIPLLRDAAAPRIVVRNAEGEVVMRDLIVPTDFLAEAAGTTVWLPDHDRTFWIGTRVGGESPAWQLVVFETGKPDGVRAVIGEGQAVDVGGLSISFAGMAAVPSAVLNDLPGAEGGAVAELSRSNRGEVLTIGPIDGHALALAPGESVVVEGLEYTYLGQREFAGITVRRDPGSTFIWVATGLLLLGLVLTFYLPRRRLWGKIVDGQAVFRGLGGRTAAIEKEVRQAAARAASAATGRQNST